MNTNCLQGYRCPHCRSDGPFEITTRSWSTWYDDGTDVSINAEICDDGTAKCWTCSHRGPVSEFHIESYHVHCGGRYCPYCGSSDLEGGAVDIDAGYAMQSVGCLQCNAGWVDKYKLVELCDYPAEEYVTKDEE